MVENFPIGLFVHEGLELVQFLVSLVIDLIFFVFDEAEISLDESIGARAANGHQTDPVVHGGDGVIRGREESEDPSMDRLRDYPPTVVETDVTMSFFIRANLEEF